MRQTSVIGFLEKMHQCQCEELDSLKNQSNTEAKMDDMNNTTTSNTPSSNTMNNGEELVVEQCESAQPLSNNADGHVDVTDIVSHVSEAVQQKTNTADHHDHLQNTTETFNNMQDNEGPPHLAALQPCHHRNIPSNQANILAMASTTNCVSALSDTGMTGFQSTFSQANTTLPEPCKPTCVIDHSTHFTESLPASSCQYPWQTQQHQQFHHNQFISANINNNASPESYHGFPRPNYGLVRQVLEVFQLCGKREMQPSEVYYELEKQFPYYRYLTPQKRKSWMSSVRHALTNPQFKARRCTDEDGKPANRRGNFWSIDDSYTPGQENTPTRPQQTYRRRSKVKSPRRCDHIQNSSPGQLISEPLAGTSMMSPPMGYPNMQSNGIPMILPSAQFAGQALQLVPSMNSGMGGNTAYMKQTQGTNSGQFLWIPPPNSSPQQQQQQLQYNGNSWHTSPIAAYSPAFNGNMPTNYNFSNNIQQQQSQHLQYQLQQQHHPQFNSAVLRHIAPPTNPRQSKPSQMIRLQNSATPGINGVNVIGSIQPITSMPSQQQMPIRTAVDEVRRLSQQAMSQAINQPGTGGDSILTASQDVGPGGDTTPTQHTNLDGAETMETQDFSQDSQTATIENPESRGEIPSQNTESQDMESNEENNSYPNTVLERPEPTNEHCSSERPSVGQASNGLFPVPVTLYTSSSTSNPDDEKTVLPSIELLTKSLTSQTVGPCSALGQISNIALDVKPTRNVDQTEITDDKDTPEGKAELRAMVFREVCNTESEQEPSPAPVAVPNLEMTPEDTKPPINTATVTEPYTSAVPSSTSVTVTVQEQQEPQTSGQWFVQQVQY